MARSRRDRLGRPIIAVTGLGVVTSLGAGQQDNWAALTAGRSGISAIDRFPTEGLATRVAGTVDFVEVSPRASPPLTRELARRAAEEAVAEARLPAGAFPGPLFMAVPPVELEWPQRFEMHAAANGAEEGYPRMIAAARQGGWRDLYGLFSYSGVADAIGDQFGTTGAPISVSTACASGATAIQLAVEALRREDCEAALCIGTDGSVTVEALVRFSLLSALSTQNEPPEKAAKPFSKNRDGFVMAEGAGALVLETLDHALARGAEVLALVGGLGDQADDFHRTRSKPDGSAIIGAIQNALDDAGLEPDAIDYVNPHGTGTPENDKMEHLALEHVFGEALAGIPVSSNKSMIGHTLTAAGAVEAVFSVLTMRNGRIPPTINYVEPDPAISLDVVPNAARDAGVNAVLSNSFGFGGQNVCLVLTAP
jgi:3-oxoacyl-[acyl-carrier-protein] synthase II